MDAVINYSYIFVKNLFINYFRSVQLSFLTIWTYVFLGFSDSPTENVVAPVAAVVGVSLLLGVAVIVLWVRRSNGEENVYFFLHDKI